MTRTASDFPLNSSPSIETPDTVANMVPLTGRERTWASAPQPNGRTARRNSTSFQEHKFLANTYAYTVLSKEMIIRSVRHRGLKRLLERDQTRELRADLVNRIRNILTALIVAEDMRMFRESAPPGWRVYQLSGDRKGTWSILTSGN